MTAQEWLEELEAKADAATPGPWVAGEVLERGTVVRGHNMIIDCRHTPDEGHFGGHNAAFIAAANPQTVQRLVAMVKFLSEQIDGKYEYNDYRWTVIKSADALQEAYESTEQKE